eukprot:TRINITY_DN1636_c0_g1_i1.p1 TRINITY_DN1636_c0_g1~~TRINITY_DN1636_c0_g1_i1.p1  ORF type:complete len:372 (+),score=142.21 TRINITY_DN1636_c0_g1_i1:59-1174(+)
MPGKNAIFVAATGQHVGKTATCLGLLGGLRSRMPNVGFMKPVGQGTVSVGGVTVDNDVHLMRGAFDLQHLRYQDMSPVVLDPTYTRAFLDGEVCSIDTMKGRITEAFETVHRSSAYTVVEGTGHMGVGSIVGLNNATVAKLLGVDVILVSSGGVGSAFDEIALNLQLCEAIGVGVRGVVLNKVQPEKLEMVQRYIQLALDNTWGHVPLLGCIPFCPDLACPSLANIRDHLRAEVLSGEDQLSKRFPNRRLVSTTSDAYYELLHSVDMEAEKDVMVITPSARADIIFATIVKWTDSPHDSGAFMLTGARPPSPEVQLLLKRANIPSLYVAHPTLEVAYSISQFVPKTQAGDKARIEQTVAHVAGAIDFDSFI